MSELNPFTSDAESDSKSSGTEKDSSRSVPRPIIRPPLVPRGLELVSRTREQPIPTPRPPLEQFVRQSLLEKSKTEEDDEDDSDEEAKTVRKQETAEEPASELAVEEDVDEQEGAHDRTVTVPQQEKPEPERGDDLATEESVEPAHGPEDARTVLSDVEFATVEERPPEPETPYEGVLHVHRPPERPEHEFGEAPAYYEDEEPLAEPSQTPPPRPAAGGGMPPVPPIEPPPLAGGFPEFIPPHDPYHEEPRAEAPDPPTSRFAAISSPNVAPITMQQHRMEVRDARERGERSAMLLSLVAGFITGYAVKAYIAQRKLQRYQKATRKEMDQRDEQISHLQYGQQELSRQLDARTQEYERLKQAAPNSPDAQSTPDRVPDRPAAPEKPFASPKSVLEMPPVKPSKEMLPPIKSSGPAEVAQPTEQIFDEEGNEIVLKPGWRVERSAGGYSVVLDEHNRVVHDAIRYGEAFKREQQREQLSDDLFATVGGSSSVGGASSQGFGGGALPSASSQSPAADYPRSSAQYQPQEVDIKHRLPKPRNPVAQAIVSPWLWTGVAVLIIIYFIAALA